MISVNILMFVFARASVLLLFVSTCNSTPISIPFDTSQPLGPDGPWQGVSVDVRYSSQDSHFQTVTLLPVFRWESWSDMVFIPTQKACSNYSNTGCGVGGVIQSPPMNAVWHYSQWWSDTDKQAGWGYNNTGEAAAGHVKLSNGLDMHTVAIFSANTSEVYHPSGITTGFESGFINVGAPYAFYWNSPPLYAYENKQTLSNSYGLHYGAAVLGYPGSFLLGGYDRGRVIGPVLSYSAQDSVQLKDISMGVEVGESPFGFKSKSGFLVSDHGMTTGSRLIELDAGFPYIGLPRSTIKAITSHLPVTFNTKSGYYLWNTEDQLYSQIVSSPSYLGFVFPSTSGNVSNANITIKVPFMLLNLTLKASASGLNSDVPYLPLVEAVNPNHLDASILLGRAFLQAAFIGANWGRNQSWLAQAPGPGKSNEGLGSFPRDLEPSDTTLDVQSGETLFRESWEGHWVPIESNTKSNSSHGPSPNSPGKPLSGGAIAGIVVGVVAFAVIVAAVALFLRKRSRSRRAPDIDQSDNHGEQEKVTGELESPKLVPSQFLQNKEVQGEDQRRELSGGWEPSELSANSPI